MTNGCQEQVRVKPCEREQGDNGGQLVEMHGSGLLPPGTGCCGGACRGATCVCYTTSVPRVGMGL